MFVRRIPRALLIHSVTHSWGKTLDKWDNETYTYSRILNRVKIESSRALKLDKDNKQVQLSAALFYCPVNSSPQGEAFSTGERITFGDTNYKIVNIDPIYDNRKLHHIELGLI